MAKKKRKLKHIARSIIQGHMEKVSSAVFERYLNEITSLISGNQGVYALYRRQKLYYIGLASNLKWRIRHHLKDKHSGKWDRFSLYVIRKEDHIREVEALLVHIAEPAGNSQKGRLKKSLNLLPKLKREVKKKQEVERKKLFEERAGSKKKVRKKKTGTRKPKTKSVTKKVERPLKGIFPTGKMIYRKYKGKMYKAWVFNNGRIKYDGQIYDSPSTVGSVVRGGKATNGWRFWKYKNKSGELVYLSELRK
ncbi:MAG TPA: DUF2924 domain-containing protein [Sedimentisphaerales bacterium]|nr:DUF2924 domain-containing protein [Sedimentisphaerales bacterium]